MGSAGIFLDALETGLPFAVAYLGVWMVFRLQNDFDLTVGGSFAMGACVTAAWLARGGDPWLALVASTVAGIAAGGITFLAMKLLKLSLVLASIIVNLGLFSANLAILGAPQANFFGVQTTFSQWQGVFAIQDTQIANITLGVVVVAVIVTALALFLGTEAGIALRASGMNQRMVRSVGVSPSWMLFITIVIGNALCGLSGSLVAQQQRFSDVNMGLDTIIVGVTAVLLGELVFRGRSVALGVVGVVFGAIVYRSLIALVLRLGVDPNLFNAITAGVVFAAVLLRNGLSLSGVRALLARRRSTDERTPA